MIHKEAFRMMQYQAENTPDGEIEWLWNSRDGVTPFIIPSKDPNGPFLQHINWQDDILALQYVPSIGQRVFIDLTRDRAHERLWRKVDHQWKYGVGGLRAQDNWASKADMFNALWPDVMDEVDRRGPDIVVVDLEMQRDFFRQREDRRREMTRPFNAVGLGGKFE